MGPKRGRKKWWAEERHEDWRAFVDSPAFQALEAIVSRGLREVEKDDIAPLLIASPPLSGIESMPAIRKRIRELVGALEGERDQDTLMALLRATPESERLNKDQAVRLARAKWTPDSAALETLQKQLKKPPNVFQLIGKIPADNKSFCRRPTPKRPPGNYFHLLRMLLEEMIPDIEAYLATTEPGEGAGADKSRDPDEAPVQPTSFSGPGRAVLADDIDAITAILERHYGTQLDVPSLAGKLLTEHDAIEGLQITVVLLDEDAEWYTFNVTREFYARLTRYTVAVVRGDESRASVMRCIPELKDIIFLPRETAEFDAAVNAMVEHGLLEIRDRTSRAGFRAAPFRPLDDRHEYAVRLEKDGAVTPDTYRLLDVELGKKAGLANYRSTLSMRMTRTRRRCAWFADGPTYIHKIDIDVSGFADAAASNHANVLYLLPGADNYSSEEERDRLHFSRTVDDWVVRHHGFVIHW